MHAKLGSIINVVSAMSEDYPKGSEAKGDLREIVALLIDLARNPGPRTSCIQCDNLTHDYAGGGWCRMRIERDQHPYVDGMDCCEKFRKA